MLTVSQAASIVGVCPKTLYRWECQGVITPLRTLGGHRRYTIELLKDSGILHDWKTKNSHKSPHMQKKTILYSRVSSGKQKTQGDLKRQEELLKEYSLNNNISNIISIKDVGSGLNTRRSGLRKMFKLVKEGKVEQVIVAFKDRLTRFGFEFIEAYFGLFGVPILAIQNSTATSPQEELVNDLMTLIACFSGKLYGMRSHCKKKTENKPPKSEKVDAE